MFSRCANPQCAKLFNYRQGRLFRFQNDRSGSSLGNACIRHFWLCDDCNRAYVLDHHVSLGVVISSRPLGGSLQNEMTRSVCCCPKAMLCSGEQGPENSTGQKLFEQTPGGGHDLTPGDRDIFGNL
jgi:hypothetical protein